MKTCLFGFFVGLLTAGGAWAQPRYTVVDLTPLLGDSAQISINDFGDMAGTVWIDELSVTEVFRLKSGQQLEWLGIYCSWDDGALINNQGQVAGTYLVRPREPLLTWVCLQ